MIDKFHMKTHEEMFGAAVAKMREKLRLSTEELAERSRVPLRLLSRIERGKANGDEFGLREICKLANGMRTTPLHLMKEYEKLVERAGEAWW